MHVALVSNEHGGVEGLLTVTDLIEAVVGRMPDPAEALELAMFSARTAPG
jgi:CBS domain containing-hemolysin-like protein